MEVDACASGPEASARCAAGGGMSGRLDPSRTSVQYAVRKPLVDWLAAQQVAGLEVLDVGCGYRPYEQLLAGASQIVSVWPSSL